MFRFSSLVATVIVQQNSIGCNYASPAPRAIAWDHLVPGAARYPENPLHKLSGPQREAVGYILRARNVILRTGRSGHSEMVLEVAEREKRLRKEGVDVETLIARGHRADRFVTGNDLAA